MSVDLTETNQNDSLAYNHEFWKKASVVFNPQ